MRLVAPPEAKGGIVLVVAIVGVVFNRSRGLLAGGEGQTRVDERRRRPAARPQRPLRLHRHRVAGLIVLASGSTAPTRRVAGRRGADAPLRDSAAGEVRPGASSRPRPEGVDPDDRPRPGPPARRGRGPRPARVGGHLRLPALSAHVVVKPGGTATGSGASSKRCSRTSSASSTPRSRSTTPGTRSGC